MDDFRTSLVQVPFSMVLLISVALLLCYRERKNVISATSPFLKNLAPYFPIAPRRGTILSLIYYFGHSPVNTAKLLAFFLSNDCDDSIIFQLVSKCILFSECSKPLILWLFWE